MGFGTPMAAQQTKMTGALLPLPLQFLAARLAILLGRVLQEQVDYRSCVCTTAEWIGRVLGVQFRVRAAVERVGRVLGGTVLASLATAPS